MYVFLFALSFYLYVRTIYLYTYSRDYESLVSICVFSLLLTRACLPPAVLEGSAAFLLIHKELSGAF